MGCCAVEIFLFGCRTSEFPLNTHVYSFTSNVLFFVYRFYHISFWFEPFPQYANWKETRTYFVLFNSFTFMRLANRWLSPGIKFLRIASIVYYRDFRREYNT